MRRAIATDAAPFLHKKARSLLRKLGTFSGREMCLRSRSSALSTAEHSGTRWSLARTAKCCEEGKPRACSHLSGMFWVFFAFVSWFEINKSGRTGANCPADFHEKSIAFLSQTARKKKRSRGQKSTAALAILSQRSPAAGKHSNTTCQTSHSKSSILHSCALIQRSDPEDKMRNVILPGCVWQPSLYLNLCASPSGGLMVQYKRSKRQRERPPCSTKDWPNPLHLQLSDHHRYTQKGSGEPCTNKACKAKIFSRGALYCFGQLSRQVRTSGSSRLRTPLAFGIQQWERSET